VPLHDAGTDRDHVPPRAYLVMALVDGVSLAEQLRTGPLAADQVRDLGAQVAAALGYVHGSGLVHRDVKPANILLAEGRAYLMDFGFANAPSLTTPNAAAQDARLAIGTPEYISPEQVTGKRAEDWRSDFFSLACVLQEMLTGRPPFTGGAPRAVMQRRLTEPPEDIRSVRSDVPDEVVLIVRRNRSTNDASAARCGCSSLTATRRVSTSSVASHTWAMPPVATRCSRRYRPASSRPLSVPRGGSATAPSNLEGHARTTTSGPARSRR
jgi:serine/threonine protein kinase